MYGFTGSSGGMSFQCKINKTFSIKTGAFFYSRVTQGKISVVNVTGDAVGKIALSVKNRVFSFPIVPIIHTQLSPKSVGYLGIGPSLFLLYNTRILLDTFDVKTNHTYFPNGEMNRMSFGLHAAIGYSYLVSKRINMNIEFRDALTIIRNKNVISNGQKLKLNSVCLILGVNYNINFKEAATNQKSL